MRGFSVGGCVAEAGGGYGAILGLAALFPFLPFASLRTPSVGVGAAPSRPYQPSFAALSLVPPLPSPLLSLSLLEAIAERLAAPSLLRFISTASQPSSQKPNPSEPPEPLFHLETARRHSNPLSVSHPLLCMDASSTKLPAALLSASPAAALFFFFLFSFCCRRVSFQVPSHRC